MLSLLWWCLQILQQVFQQLDASGDGCLQHDELRGLVSLIPGLDGGEVRFIMAALYHGDLDSDGSISIDELQVPSAPPGAPHCRPCRCRPQPPQRHIMHGIALVAFALCHAPIKRKRC
jgi:hypothetical protein